MYVVSQLRYASIFAADVLLDGGVQQSECSPDLDCEKILP